MMRLTVFLDDSLGVAFDNGVQELNITALTTCAMSPHILPYTLPSAMFDSPKLLTYLRVEECNFPQNVSKCSSINFPFLKTLIMCRACIDDGMLQKLLSSSPSLEKIVFFFVSGFKKFRVSNLGKLKILDIHTLKAIVIDVEDAPCLRLLSINDNCLKDLVAKSPLLEDLKIEKCDELERVYFLSSSLRHLDFICCKMLVEAIIDAPNLPELRYVGKNTFSLSLNNTPDEPNTFKCIDNSGLYHLNNEWFKQLRELLKAVNQARVYFRIWSLDQGIEVDIAHDSKENPLPLEHQHQTENLMSLINHSSSLFVVFVETLFSSSRPAMEMERKMDMDRDNEDIHQILSYLPPEEAARTTALSKTWLQSYSTSPFLTFDKRFFTRVWWLAKIVENRYPFFNFVNNTLLRYIRLNLRIQKLEISVFRVDHEPAYHLLDESLGVAFDNGVQELHISVDEASDFSSLYTLPSAMFDSPKLFTYLGVNQCKFPQNVVSNSKCSSINFPFLQTLIIYRVYIDDGMLQKLLSCSPSLETIVFSLVSGFKKFRVRNLEKLKILDINSDSTIEIDIEDVPSLRLLKYRGCPARPCLLKVGNALQNQSLKHLELHLVSISDIFLKVLVTKFQLLEHLQINGCDGLERISIVSASLKHLIMKLCNHLVKAEIDAPKLLELEYFGENASSLSLNNTPEELMPYINLFCFDTGGLSDAWFHLLTGLLKSVTRASVSFKLLNVGIKFDTTLDSRENTLPLIWNDVPEMNPPSPLFAIFVNTLFSSSRPTSVHSCSPEPVFFDFMKFLSSELIITMRNSNCCSSDQTKCWRHYLKDIKVEVYEDSQKVWQPLH